MKSRQVPYLAGVLAIAATQVGAQEVKTSSPWEFYGRAHLSVDQLNDGKDYNKMNLSSNSSRIGFRGAKTFGDLKGLWQIETEIQFNRNPDTSVPVTGVSGTTGTGTQDTANTLATRDTFAGLEGSWGTFRVGKFDTPMKVAREPANLFGDQLGDMRNITRASLKFDERPANIMEYKSPNMGGLQLMLAYVPHDGKTATANKDNGLSSYGLTYKAGNLDLAAAQEAYQQDNADGKRNGNRFAASYKLSSNLRVVGFYQDATDKATATAGTANDKSAKTTGYGAEYAITPGKTFIKFHSMKQDAKKANTNATLNAIGIEHLVDRQLRFYVNYAAISNDSAAKVTPWKEGRSTDVSGVAGQSATGISIGMRYDF